MKRNEIPAGNSFNFGHGSVEVIGYHYNVSFYCANGNLPTLDCNTSGTSPFTSTNKNMNALDPPNGRQCQVTAEVDGSFVSGDFTLSMSYPHVTEGIPIWNYTTVPLSWRATADEMDSALEAVRDIENARAFGSVSVERHVYWPAGVFKWSGQFNWSITFDSRPGDVPEMQSSSSLVSNIGDVAVRAGTARNGNEIGGGYGLTFCPSETDCMATNATYFSAFLTEDEMKYRFSEAFFTRGSVQVNVSNAYEAAEARIMYMDNKTDVMEASDWLRLDGADYNVDSIIVDDVEGDYDHIVILSANILSNEGEYGATFGTTAISVTRTGPTQAMGYAWEVTFSNKTVGGNQPEIKSDSDELVGSGVDITMTETEEGNQLTGTFTLSYNGETSSEIPFDASAGSVQSAINSLSSVYPSRVDVSRTDETIDRSQQVGGHTWTITFDSDTWHDPTDHSSSEIYLDGSWIGDAAEWQDTWPSTGAGRFSKAWGKNVGSLPDMECSSDGLGTTRGDGSEDCKVLTKDKCTISLLRLYSTVRTTVD